MCLEYQQSCDKELEFYSGVGHHKKEYYEKEVAVMVKELKDEDLYSNIPGRAYPSFQAFRENTHKWNGPNIDKWLNEKKMKLDRQICDQVRAQRIRFFINILKFIREKSMEFS